MTAARTYKFLARGARGPLSGAQWPEPSKGPGAWVESAGPLALCAVGAHVCRPADLAHWLHDELWETEVDGERLEGIDCLVVRRARLVRRIDAWHEGGAARFAAACAHHAGELADRADAATAAVRGYVEDAAMAARAGYPAVGAHAAALAVAGLADASDEEAAYRGERAWQADWIVRFMIGA